MRPEGVDDDLPEQALALSDIMAACLTLKDGVRRNAYNATHDAASAERDAPPSAQSAGLSNQGNAPVLARANDLSSSAILREAPVDLRVAPLARDPERIRDRAKRSAADDAHWAEDATLGVRYVAMILDTMIVFIRLALFAALRGLVFRNTTLWYLLCATTLSLVTFALKMLYCAWGECGRHRATLGKRMMSLQVVRMDGETGVSVLRAACGGALWMATDRKLRADARLFDGVFYRAQTSAARQAYRHSGGQRAAAVCVARVCC